MTDRSKRLRKLFTIAGVAALAPALTAEHAEKLLKGWEFHHGDLGGVWEVWRAEQAPFEITHDVAWTTVEMPHCWNAFDAVDPDVEYYQGPGWYRTYFELRNPYESGRVLLRFQGAGQKTIAFVGTDPVGSHVGGYDEFTFDITDALAATGIRNGDTVPLAVRCDNSRDLEMMPSDLSDFFIYGGLYRYVEVLYVPAISIEHPHYAVEVDEQGAARVRVSGRMRNPLRATDDLECSLSITGPGGEPVWSGQIERESWRDRDEIFSFSIEEPALWSPDTPNLYTAKLELTVDGETQMTESRFGVRTFRFEKHGPFYLNGERLLLRGTHRHEDHAGLGAALREDLLRREFELIKEVGANFIRLGHYQQPRQVLELCDELGLLVWEEIPWCRGGVGGAEYREQGRRMLRNMITQHYNHPSVIMWGLGNEQWWPGDYQGFDEQAVRNYMTELNALAKELDPSRVTTIRYCDFARDIVDVYSPSIWAGWYRGVYTDYKKVSYEQMRRVDHFFHAEWGGSSHVGRYNKHPDALMKRMISGQGAERLGDYLMAGGDLRISKDSDWSESYICNLFDWGLKEQETMPWLTGAAQWAFKDFATPLRPENPIPYMNQKGLVQRDLRKKEAFFVFQSYWTDEPMVHIFGQDWVVRWGEENERHLLKVYSNCPEVELFLNGESLGTRQRDSQDFPAAGLRWEAVLKSGANTLEAVGWKDGEEVRDVQEFEYTTHEWGEPARLELVVAERDGNRIVCEATVRDARGRLCPDATNTVRFGAAGDAELIDNLGTIDGSRVVQVSNGRARIVATTKGGAAAISVAGEGLETALVTLDD